MIGRGESGWGMSPHGSLYLDKFTCLIPFIAAALSQWTEKVMIARYNAKPR